MTKQQNESAPMQKIKVKGNQLVDRIRDIMEEGNARRVIIKKDDRTLMEFPLSVGVGGATAAVLLAPTLAAIGAFAALVTDVELHVERIAPEPGALPTTATPPPPSAKKDMTPTGGTGPNDPAARPPKPTV